MSRRDVVREFLNDPKEWHALWHGYTRSVRSRRSFRSAIPDPENDDAQEEPHYFKLGWVLGDVTQVAVLGGVGTKLGGLW